MSKQYEGYIKSGDELAPIGSPFGNSIVLSDYFIVLTQEQYDALETKDENKFYFIKE